MKRKIIHIHHDSVPNQFWSVCVKAVTPRLNFFHSCAFSQNAHCLYLLWLQLQNHSSGKSKPEIYITLYVWEGVLTYSEREHRTSGTEKVTPTCSTPTVHLVWDLIDKIWLDITIYFWVDDAYPHTYCEMTFGNIANYYATIYCYTTIYKQSVMFNINTQSYFKIDLIN